MRFKVLYQIGSFEMYIHRNHSSDGTDDERECETRVKQRECHHLFNEYLNEEEAISPQKCIARTSGYEYKVRRYSPFPMHPQDEWEICSSQVKARLITVPEWSGRIIKE